MKDETILEITEKVELAITTLSDQIGVGADKFYPIIVEQMYWEGIVGVITGLLILAIGLLSTIVGWKEYKKNNDPFGWMMVAFIATPIGLLTISAWVLNIFNPEYYAFMEITSLLK